MSERRIYSVEIECKVWDITDDGPGSNVCVSKTPMNILVGAESALAAKQMVALGIQDHVRQPPKDES